MVRSRRCMVGPTKQSPYTSAVAARPCLVSRHLAAARRRTTLDRDLLTAAAGAAGGEEDPRLPCPLRPTGRSFPRPALPVQLGWHLWYFWSRVSGSLARSGARYSTKVCVCDGLARSPLERGAPYAAATTSAVSTAQAYRIPEEAVSELDAARQTGDPLASRALDELGASAPTKDLLERVRRQAAQQPKGPCAEFIRHAEEYPAW